MGNSKIAALIAAAAATALMLSGCSVIEQVLGGDNAVRDEDSSEITEGGDLDVFTLAVGDCFDDDSAAGTEISEIPVVPCSEPHDNEVYHEFTLDEGEYPGGDVIETAADEGCFAEFESFVGIDYESSVYGYSWLTPTESGWNELDDRLVQCVVYEYGEKLTGSVAGTAR